MKGLATGSLACVLLVCAPWPTSAEDLAPPSYRGDAFSTTQEWDFVTSGTLETGFYLAPDGVGGITNNPFGDATATIYEGSWHSGDGPGPGGAWYTDLLEFVVPGGGPSGPATYRLLRLQATFYDPQGREPNVLVFDDFVEQGASTEPIGDDWWHFTQDWRSEPNADSEIVRIWNPTGDPLGYGFSEVVIDTLAVPEPAALLLLALSVLVVSVARRGAW